MKKDSLRFKYMKLSLTWLRQLIDLPSHLTPQEVGDNLTLHTAELEEIIDKSELYNQVVAGKLVDIQPHPNSDKLSIGTFDCGDHGGKRQVLFGQVHPVYIGEVYPIALPGLVLSDGKTIAEVEMGGILSQGMVIDNQELGMKNAGFMQFTESDTGKTLAEILPMCADQLFDIDNKSLTHRPDLMGHLGFARELGAIFDVPFTYDYQSDKISHLAPRTSKDLKVTIDTPHCRRFMGARLSGITVADSPLETSVLLENLGTRAISNIVDITNLILLKHGQPMHAFDASKVKGAIIVRQAKAGEKLIALDEIEYELTPDDIVIADEEKVLSIGGVMGGLESAVTAKTTEVIFECANFCPMMIRKTSQRLGLRSESSMRYEKSLDPENCANGIAEAIEITFDRCPEAKLISAVTDIYPHPATPTTVLLDPERVRSVSGIAMSVSEMVEILTRLGFAVNQVNGSKNDPQLEVTIPSFRATKDVSIPEDLIEEIVRMHGYTHVAALLPSQPVTPPHRNYLRELEWRIRDTLSSSGYNEVIHSSFCAPDDHEWLEANQYVEMMNAPTAETQYLRQSLSSNFVRHLESELRTHGMVEVFEIGNIYQTQPTGLPYQEQRQLGIFCAMMGAKNADLFYRLKLTTEQLLLRLGFPASDIHCAPSDTPAAIYHPHQAAEIMLEGQVVGTIGTLHPSKCDIQHAVVALVEINLNKITALQSAMSPVEYQHDSPYPIMHRDLSIITDRKTLVSEVSDVINAAASHLKAIHFFDEYIDEKRFGAERKNLAFHLDFQSSEHTLTAEEVQADFDVITAHLKSQLGAELRVEYERQ